MRCLITGATGFVGPHLAAALLAGGDEVVGLARHSAAVTFPLRSVDLLDCDATVAVLRDVRPDWIFHLAGYADNRKSIGEPAEAWKGNLSVTMSFYDAIRQAPIRPRILFVSSGLVYGDAGSSEEGFTENAVLAPTTPYAASKAAADLLSFQQTCSSGLDIVRVRPFNQIGPGQPPDYVVSSFASQIVNVELGHSPNVAPKGNLNGRRDLTDVRDMVRAYIRLMEVGVTGEVYNAGSGQTYVIRDVLDRLRSKARVPVLVQEPDSDNLLKDPAISRADISKLRATTGWSPTYTLDQTLADVLEDWRTRMQAGGTA